VMFLAAIKDIDDLGRRRIVTEITAFPRKRR